MALIVLAWALLVPGSKLRRYKDAGCDQNNAFAVFIHAPEFIVFALYSPLYILDKLKRESTLRPGKKLYGRSERQANLMDKFYRKPGPLALARGGA